ncbi:MAG: hypothetical protein ACRDK7_14690 [Solirubrobacteraceae bacterium]
MSYMEHPPASQPYSADQGLAQDKTDTDDRDIPHFESLILPGLVSIPPMPAWLRKLFRRKATPTAP